MGVELRRIATRVTCISRYDNCGVTLRRVGHGMHGIVVIRASIGLASSQSSS